MGFSDFAMVSLFILCLVLLVAVVDGRVVMYDMM
jgi:hypothetical protein